MRRACALMLAAGALGALAPRFARAQGFLDQGVFVIARDGNEIGREDFAIRATAGRQGVGGVLAVATGRLRDREYRAALELTSDYVPLSYQLDVTAGGRITQRLSAQFGRGRCAIRIASSTGEVAREFPIPPVVAVLDDDAFDQFYFVPRASEGETRTVSVVRPGATRVVSATVRPLGSDTVSVGGQTLQARRYAITLPGADEREFWFSASGDLLKVALPASGITATRLSPPSR